MKKRKHKNHVTLTPIAEHFGSGAVTTCFNDLGLSQLGFEHPTFCLRGKRSNPLCHHRGPRGRMYTWELFRNTNKY